MKKLILASLMFLSVNVYAAINCKNDKQCEELITHIEQGGKHFESACKIYKDIGKQIPKKWAEGKYGVDEEEYYTLEILVEIICRLVPDK
ncbi:hypothetical protein NHP164001_12500 [Helicobacter trogontum]|uniref:Uncharacterized protein n=1 Tax=Helicobacter trogontum TaxID=50960 RepID=A0ABQ0D4H8_9HELI